MPWYVVPSCMVPEKEILPLACQIAHAYRAVRVYIVIVNLQHQVLHCVLPVGEIVWHHKFGVLVRLCNYTEQGQGNCTAYQERTA